MILRNGRKWGILQDERRSKNKRRRKADSPKKKEKRKRRWVMVIEGGILTILAVLLICIAVNEINEGIEYAEKLREQINNTFFAILEIGIALVGPIIAGAIMTIFVPDKNSNIITMVMVLSVLAVFMIVYSCLGFGLSVYAGHKIAEYEESQPIDTKDVSEAEEDKFDLKEFNWIENLYVENLEDYLGVGADESEIRDLLMEYLQTSVELVEVDKAKFENYMSLAGGYQNDYKVVEMTETKIFSCEKEIEARKNADTNYSDSDNIKLNGDCFVHLGDLQADDAVGYYESALKEYIRALHIAYYCEGERAPAIEKKDIWSAMGDVYEKLANRPDLQEIERERAFILKGICEDISTNN